MSNGQLRIPQPSIPVGPALFPFRTRKSAWAR